MLVAGGGAVLFSELGETLFIIIGLNAVGGIVRVGWSKNDAGLFTGGGMIGDLENKFGDCLNAGWVSVGLGKSLTSTEGVRLCC